MNQELAQIRKQVEAALAEVEKIMQALLRVRALALTEALAEIGGRV